MRKIIWFFAMALFLFFTGFSSAQQEIENCINYRKAGDYQKAIEAGKKAVKLYPKNSDAHFCLGKAYVKTGNLRNALIELKMAEQFEKDRKNLGYIYSWLGSTYADMGDFDNAFFYHSKSLSIAKDFGDKQEESNELNNLAALFHQKGELDKALKYYEQSLKLESDEKEKAPTLNNIAMIYNQKEDYKKAEEYLLKAIEISTRAGDYHGAAKRMLNLGDTYRLSKNFSKTEKTINEGLKRILKIGDKYGEATAYKYLGWLYRDMGNIKSAKEYFTKAYELYNSIGAKEGAVDVRQSLLLLEKRKK